MAALDRSRHRGTGEEGHRRKLPGIHLGHQSPRRKRFFDNSSSSERAAGSGDVRIACFPSVALVEALSFLGH